MKAIDLAELKQIQLQILSYTDKVCKENSLRYSLSGGSLIGAVRHKGYIPWDDDIDIFLPRPDYEKLIEIIGADKNSQYEVITCFNRKDYSKPFAKICDKKTVLEEAYDREIKSMGINIDVFPEDGLPSDPKKLQKYWDKMRIIKRFASMVYQKRDKKAGILKNMLRFVCFYFFKLLPANFMAKKINRIAVKHSFDESNFIACIVFGYGQKEQIPRTVFDEFIEVPFENKTFSIIKNYDTYLSSLYGEYMQFPPKEKQVSKHSFFAYYKE